MDRRGLSVLGVLTSWRDEEAKNEERRGKHRREQAWFVRAAGDGSDDQAQDPKMDDVDDPTSSTHVLTNAKADALADALWIGLQASDDLRLKAHRKEASLVGQQRTRRRAYMQKNTDATRKVTAPVVKGILEEALRKDV
jgi:exopolyphosphatase